VSAAPLRGRREGSASLEDAGSLIRSPVALAGDETGRHVDRAPGERAQLGEGLRVGAAPHPVALQSASEAGSGIFRGVDADLGLGEPLAGRDLGRDGISAATVSAIPLSLSIT